VNLRAKRQGSWLALCSAFVLMLPAGLAAASATPGAQPSSTQINDAYLAEMSEWRQRRHDRLANEDGWLTLVGLEWLREGSNRIGSDADNDIRLDGGPGHWGTVELSAGGLHFTPAPDANLTIDGAAAAPTRLVPDAEGQPTIVRSDNLSFHVILRGSYALRIKDRMAPTLLGFQGVDSYPIDERWRKDTRFVPAEPGRTIEIANVLGQSEDMMVAGTVEFEHEGREFSLLALQEQGANSLWFLFADRSNGRETYGAGRFLYSDGMPENGRLVVDFNKSYNPPCAFSDYSTCPLPPQQNRLDLVVTAGEKDYHPD
jgi:uncharacterized protein (DUF1684 family)